MILTTAIKKLSKLKKRIRAVPGGTSAAKTMGILALLIHLAQTDEKPTITSVVSESMPHLRKGAMRDFLRILEEQNYFNRDRWNKTDSTYTFETGSKIEFFSVDASDKVRGPRRDRLFLNEANNTPYDTFEQLEIRTNEFIFLDWNPTNEFWYYTELKGQRDDVEELTLTYKDNEGLSPQIIESIERRMPRKSWWNVYGLGLLGEVEGKIYKDWHMIDEIPPEAKLLRRGLDLGYSVDPTAIVEIYSWNGAFIANQITYQKGLSNKQIADILLNLEEPECLVVADSAEPKSIDELISYGVNVIPANKGPGSVRHGIQVVQWQRMFVTRRSVDIWREQRNYLWAVDKNGVLISPNEPEHAFSHTMDAIRYPMESLHLDAPHSEIEDYLLQQARINQGVNFNR